MYWYNTQIMNGRKLEIKTLEQAKEWLNAEESSWLLRNVSENKQALVAYTSSILLMLVLKECLISSQSFEDFQINQKHKWEVVVFKFINESSQQLKEYLGENDDELINLTIHRTYSQFEALLWLLSPENKQFAHVSAFILFRGLAELTTDRLEKHRAQIIDRGLQVQV
jgi:hypothetical protein